MVLACVYWITTAE